MINPKVIQNCKATWLSVVFFSYECGDISEGQACELLKCDRLLFRASRDEMREYYKSWIGRAAPRLVKCQDITEAAITAVIANAEGE